MEQSSMLFQKDGKNYLQLDCENAKELSMKLGEKTYPFTKDGKKWILELPFSTAVNYVQICVDGQEVLLPELPIGHGYCHLYNYIELPDGNELTEIRDIPHGTLAVSYTHLIAMIPVLIVYPFLQRYFVDGITLGSVKG